MIQLTEKQVKALADAARLYKQTSVTSPETASKEFGTLIVDDRSEVVQLVQLGLATEDAQDDEMKALLAKVKGETKITLRVLTLTKEAVMLFMDAKERAVN